jgi:3-oxoacyl-[acyl-carrier protein] reductase
MDLGIKGKTALILGASRGLGRASAIGLANEGVSVLGAARNPIEKCANIIPIVADLSVPSSVAALIQDVLARGGVDILVNNAGGPPAGEAARQSTDVWTRAFASLALPLFEVTAALLPIMIEKQWGRIITIGSSGIVQPIPNLALSNAIRGSVAGWSKTLATEVARDGITVNMVLPGRIDTDRVRELDASNARTSGKNIDEVQAASCAQIPIGRYGSPEEFGAAVTFLASRQASYITGSMIAVDGGAIRALR